ncbi:MAG: hypothetical protein AAFO29_26145 [Actinomycetota bacterium]
MFSLQTITRTASVTLLSLTAALGAAGEPVAQESIAPGQDLVARSDRPAERLDVASALPSPAIPFDLDAQGLELPAALLERSRPLCAPAAGAAIGRAPRPGDAPLPGPWAMPRPALASALALK